MTYQSNGGLSDILGLLIKYGSSGVLSYAGHTHSCLFINNEKFVMICGIGSPQFTVCLQFGRTSWLTV